MPRCPAAEGAPESALAELDQAVSDNPTLLYVAFTGPAITNTKGRVFLIAQGVEVNDTGFIAAGRRRGC